MNKQSRRSSVLCQSCGRRAPLKHVVLCQNTALIVVRITHSVRGNLCKRCIRKHGIQLTLWTLFTGWCGPVSAILNITYIINNIAALLGTFSMGDGAKSSGFPVLVPTEETPVVPPPIVRKAGGATITIGGGSLTTQRAAPQNSLEACQPEISRRLFNGDAPAQIAEDVARQTGVSLQLTTDYVDLLALTCPAPAAPSAHPPS